MQQELSDADLDAIEERAHRAFEVAPTPWHPWLETRAATGGCSFVQFGGESDVDNEMYVEVRLGSRQLVSPDPQLDAVIDFVGNAPHDIARLVAEVKRLKQQGG